MLLSIFSQKPLFVRATLSFLVLSLILMLLDSQKSEWFVPFRDASHASMQPIYQMSLIPSFAAHYADGAFESKESLRRENIRLQTELLQAKVQLQQQDHLIAQNARLKGVLSTTESANHDLLLARIIGTDSNPLKQIVVLNKGENDGVKIGQTVIDENGILGQVINTYPNTSRLVLITDEQQSVAVVVARTGQRAVVSGSGRPDGLNLDFIFKTSDVQVGDELVSSGLGSRLPAGYRVGTIADIDTTRTDNFADITVTPAANILNSSHVLILQPKQ
ncbi:rod shape-determining protein MreC [Moraxella nasibovis]|uniref:rod shape-determining protein MreC n=1 Tax=Moraxella nasibovis TaxID=2904120 RepID=UPI00240FC8E4|nr:rod shape-determining protein MreC [Moraxella nasibovis]WFF38359.1 rod shape-determining protein MreC [Moraxella nasibovis]